MQNPIEITVFMKKEEAELFLAFQKHHDLFKFLLEQKVFEQKKASVTIDFNHEGIITSIRRADYLYSAKSFPHVAS